MSTNSEPDALNGAELDTWSAFATVLEWLPPALDAQLQQHSDLSHFEYGILFALADADGRTLRMSALAGFANSSLSRLSHATGRLEKRGWVRRTPDPADGRTTLAALTDSGLARFTEASPGHARAVRGLVLSKLTEAQTRQLKEISLRIAGAIRDEHGWRP